MGVKLSLDQRIKSPPGLADPGSKGGTPANLNDGEQDARAPLLGLRGIEAGFFKGSSSPGLSIFQCLDTVHS